MDPDPAQDPTPDPSPFFIGFPDAKKNIFFIFFLITCPQAKKFNFVLKFCVKYYFAGINLGRSTHL
jgi:hypothetical protein